MNHLRTISRERPAIAQGLSGIQAKVADILAILGVFVFIRDELLGKGPDSTGT